MNKNNHAVRRKFMSKNPPRGRRDTLGRRLDEGQALVATELALEFGVSEDAIRRDLRALATEGRCRRVYGGALPISPASTPMKKRIEEDREGKRALASAAATLIKRGELVFLDCGSTNLALAGHLPRDRSITVATNSVAIASVVLDRGIPLILIGGIVDANIGGAVDPTAIQALQNLNIDRCFLGVCAVSAREGVGVFGADDAAFKRALLEVSRETVALLTNDKIETRARHRVAPLSRIASLVVEHGVDGYTLETIKKAGPVVIIAPQSA
jgi:DeoR/GlpR family transcriptional regulator of sugar metabolism